MTIDRSTWHRTPSRRRPTTAIFIPAFRLHVLHRAATQPTFGQAMITELGGRGYRLSAGTLIRTSWSGAAGSHRRRASRDGRSRRVYRVTPSRRRVLETARLRVKWLFGEMLKPARARRKGRG